MLLSGRVEVADILVHVEDISMTETFDIFGYIDDLLQVLVLSRVEDWVVDYHSINVLVGVGGDYGVFNFILGHFAEGVAVSAVLEKLC